MTSEKSIQTTCINYLSLLEARGDCYGARTQVIKTKTVRKDGSFGYLRTGKVGLPDWTGCFGPGGIFVGIEFKSSIGKQTETQKITQNKIQSLGGRYWVIRSVNELVAKIKELKSEYD